MPRMVNCVKLGRELPGLDKPPFPGVLGQRIYENISKQAFDLWPAQSTLIINHYGLNMADPDGRKLLREQMGGDCRVRKWARSHRGRAIRLRCPAARAGNRS